ncbi:hypothetical protein PYW07_011675 [Mythimna separata]|uniref:Uncharacterized protein n=1 Tax=Mythimna separata TaxID=271217 RepID=A0AAD7Y6Z3_MYTSE|nr:hypothetical protein PYW07_011675 [Mythimna separata]
MASKAILVLCAQALFVQSIYSQAIPCAKTIAPAIVAEEYVLSAGNALPCGNARVGLASYPAVANSFAPSSGGGFLVQSISPIAPTGITVFSENAIEGALAVNGELPFLSAVTVEGALPSSGAGGINYGCGNGAVGIVSEGISPAAPASYPSGLGFTPSAAGGFGYGSGLAGRGYGGLAFGQGACGCSGHH